MSMEKLEIRTRRPSVLLGLLLLFALLLAACGDDDGDPAADTATTDTAAEATGPTAGTDGLEGTIRLGLFPNVTHAPALVAVEEGFYADALGDGVDVEVQSFDSGTTAAEALFAGSIDMTFIGPNPAINGWAQSAGDLHIVAGSTSGGASLVVRPDITSPDDLAGATLATPSLGNTQDVALRYWLGQQGYETTPEGGGDVSIQPQDNAQTLDLFTAGEIDGAWVPEPWATRLVEEGGGTVLVDEADLWPDGRFVTTHLVAASSFLEEHPDLVQAFLAGHLDAIAFTRDHPEDAQAAVVAQIGELTGQEVDPATIAGSWEHLEFTADPVASSLAASADHAVEVGLLEPVDLEGIYDLSLLNAELAARGEPEIAADLP